MPIIIQFSNPNYEPLSLPYLFLQQGLTLVLVPHPDKYLVNKTFFCPMGQIEPAI
jgi:hypothetical protein